MWICFYQGTSAEQDNRFLDKQKKLLKSMRFANVLNQKVSDGCQRIGEMNLLPVLIPLLFVFQVEMDKVNLDVIKPWITKRLIEVLGFEDDVVLQFIFNMLESEKVSRLNYRIQGHFPYSTPEPVARRLVSR